MGLSLGTNRYYIFEGGIIVFYDVKVLEGGLLRWDYMDNNILYKVIEGDRLKYYCFIHNRVSIILNTDMRIKFKFVLNNKILHTIEKRFLNENIDVLKYFNFNSIYYSLKYDDVLQSVPPIKITSQLINFLNIL